MSEKRKEKTCYECKKPIRKGEKAGYWVLRGDFHKACWTDRGIPIISDLIFPLYRPHFGADHAHFWLYAVAGLLLLVATVIGGVFIFLRKLDAVATWFVMILAAALVILPLLYYFAEFYHKKK